MKINSLKFKQISHIINQKTLKLNLFQGKDVLFDEDRSTFIDKTFINSSSKFDFQKIVRKRTNMTDRSERPKSSIPKCEKLTKRRSSLKDQPQDCFYYLQKNLVAYIASISLEQKKSIRKQMNDLLKVFQGEVSFNNLMERIQEIQKNVSKMYTNRLMHLVFYLIFNKFLGISPARIIGKQIKNLILCEYYSRKFKFDRLSLAICIEIQAMYCQAGQYEQSRNYARRSLRLAVVVKDEYSQAKMIGALSILNYYEGRLSEYKNKLLDKQQKRRIIQTYNEEMQTPNLLNINENQFKKYHAQQFSIENRNNFIQNSTPNHNVKYFQQNYHDILKVIKGKCINVRGMINKVASVGQVKKYLAQDNYITLKPQCHVVKPLHQGQVMLTHKKNSKGQKGQFLMQTILPRFMGILQSTIGVLQSSRF